MTEETVSMKISSNGQIIIPKKWLEELGLNDNDLLELAKSDDKIIIRKKKHPLEEIIGIFDDSDFTEEDHKAAQRSLFEGNK
ncbi:MAG: AbrB/MazE/SpoVT family DNA-binding domain-containing protein [Candidatus Lokiarchaeota archaeon]|nr:AbrB/MazE/SpoVT family DNA-binding domain-containing protein [Candidatus Lokiarchaeota archaeon]